MKPSSKRPIDLKRDSAGSFTIGEAGETSKAMITTEHVLYSVMEHGIYAVQMADQIDPDRTNADLPPTVQQRVLAYGSDDPIAARTFMTAGVLFDRTYLGQSFPVDEGKLLSLELASRLGTLQDALDALVANERRVVEELDKLVTKGSLRVPSVPDLRSRVEGFLAGADRIQETLFAIAHLFYPRPKSSLDTRRNLLDQIERKTPGRDAFHASMKVIVELLHEVREHRNASVHTDGPKALLVRDFHLLPTGDLSAPMMEIRHPRFASPNQPVTHYMHEKLSTLTDASETMLAWLCSENLSGPASAAFKTQLARMPEGETHHGSRYCYHTAIEGPWPPPTGETEESDRPPPTNAR
jgi:hypothetical protein